MKSKFTLWSVVLFLAGFIFIGCDNERTENASDFQTGIHKIAVLSCTMTRENTLVIPILPK